MKLLTGIVVLFVALTALSSAQQKVVHFKKLQEFLPVKEIPDFKRGKPIGSTSTAMGMSTSEASVRYVKPAPSDSVPEQSIQIKIADMSLMPAWQSVYQQADFENETEDGYEKSVTIKTYKGIEKASTGDSKSCELNIAVGSRFHVMLECSGTSDAKILRELLDSMDLAKLEQLQLEK